MPLFAFLLAIQSGMFKSRKDESNSVGAKNLPTDSLSLEEIHNQVVEE